jgi:hypothetical protein
MGNFMILYSSPDIAKAAGSSNVRDMVSVQHKGEKRDVLTMWFENFKARSFGRSISTWEDTTKIYLR